MLITSLPREQPARLGVAQQRPDLVRLDADQHDVGRRGRPRRLSLVVRMPCFSRSARTTSARRSVAKICAGFEPPRTQDPADDGFAHRAAAEHGQRLVLGEHDGRNIAHRERARAGAPAVKSARLPDVRPVRSRKHLADAHRIVVKLGTHVVTHDGVELALGRADGLVESLARLRQAGREVVLVSSGAVGMGMRVLGLKERPRSLGLRQACAAVGQGHLMSLYTAGVRAAGRDRGAGAADPGGSRRPRSRALPAHDADAPARAGRRSRC